MLALKRWFAWQRWPWLPARIRSWQHMFRVEEMVDRFYPQMLEIEQQTMMYLWASPDEATTAILQGIADEFGSRPRAQIYASDCISINVVECSEQEADRLQAGESFHLGDDRLRGSWLGHRDRWFWEGHDVIEPMLTPNPSGLMLLISHVGPIFDQVIAQPADLEDGPQAPAMPR